AEDAVRHPDLADVVQLGRACDLVELFVAEVDRLAERHGEWRDAVEVIPEHRGALLERAEEHVAGLSLRRARTAALLRVHAPVGEAKGFDGVRRLIGHEDRYPGTADREAG